MFVAPIFISRSRSICCSTTKNDYCEADKENFFDHGFGIYKYSGNGYAGATIAHGLGAKPHLILVKILNTTDNWCGYHKSLGATKRFELNNSTTPTTSTTLWNDTEPTSTVFSLGTNGQVNGSGNTYIAYVFTEKVGYSKFGSYTGNGNADGPFIHTGFKPAFYIIKKTDSSKNWFLHDNKRGGVYNPQSNYVNPNLSEAENSFTGIDILSNGLKLRTSGTGHNQNGASYIFMAFGQSLVGSNNVPCTAR